MHNSFCDTNSLRITYYVLQRVQSADEILFLKGAVFMK